MNAIFTAFQDIALKSLATQARRRALALAYGRAGGLLVETVISVSLMTIVGTAVLSGLSTTHISGAKTERQSIGENIARNQMAYVFSAPYEQNSDPYSAIALPAEYSGYSVEADTEEVDPVNPDPCIQKVIVTVDFEGSQVFDLESIKTDPLC